MRTNQRSTRKFLKGPFSYGKGFVVRDGRGRIVERWEFAYRTEEGAAFNVFGWQEPSAL